MFILQNSYSILVHLSTISLNSLAPHSWPRSSMTNIFSYDQLITMCLPFQRLLLILHHSFLVNYLRTVFHYMCQSYQDSQFSIRTPNSEQFILCSSYPGIRLSSLGLHNLHGFDDLQLFFSTDRY